MSGAGSDKIALTDDRMMVLVPSEVFPSKQVVKVFYMSKNRGCNCYIIMKSQSCDIGHRASTPSTKHLLRSAV